MNLPDANILPESLKNDDDALQVAQANIFAFVDRCIREIKSESEDVTIKRLVVGRDLVAALIPDYLDDLEKWNANPVKQVGVYPNGTELFVSRKDGFINVFYKTEDGSTSREFDAPDDVMNPEEDDVTVEALLEDSQ